MLTRLACSLVICSYGYAATLADARDVITRVLEAERENRRRMVNYVFREEVIRRYFDRERNPVGDSRAAYEVVFIEGRPAFRRMDTNGRPLTDEEERAEMARLRQLAEDRKRNPEAPSAAEEHRRPHHSLPAFLKFHEFRFAGEETVDGRECWVISSRPKEKAKPGPKDDKRIAHATARFWVDKETLHRVRTDVTSTEPVGSARVHESTSYHWAQRDGSVWLIARIETVLPMKGRSNQLAWVEGEQIYSKYRRFTSESSVTAVEEVGGPQP